MTKYNPHPGPRKESDLRTLPRDRPDNTSARPDSYKYLVHNKVYPEAGRVTSCLSLTNIPEPALSYFVKAITKSSQARPGHFVFGARLMPVFKESAKVFFETCGFDAGSVEILTREFERGPLT